MPVTGALFRLLLASLLLLTPPLAAASHAPGHDAGGKPDGVPGQGKPTLRVGSAKVVINPQAEAGHFACDAEQPKNAGNPDSCFYLGGYGIRMPNVPEQLPGADQVPVLEPAAGNHPADQIHVRVFYLHDTVQNQELAFVTLDAIGAGNVISAQLKAAIGEVAGIAPENILFGQTHTHSSADLQGLWGGVPAAWRAFLYAQAAKAVKVAKQTAAPARLFLGRADEVELNNYRRPRRLGNETTDRALTVLQARDDDRVLGTLVQYAAHPTNLGAGDRLVHSDYVDSAMDTIEDRYGATAVFFNGPIADASPRRGEDTGADHDQDGVRDNYDKPELHGQRVGAAALAALERAVRIDSQLSVRHVTAQLPVTNPLFLAAGGAGFFKNYYQFFSTPLHDIAAFAPVLADVPDLTLTAEALVSRVSLGSEANRLEIVTIPGEATNTFGRMIRGIAGEGAGEQGATTVMLLGLTQASYGYILPEEEYSYFDESGDAGLVAPYTAYEENVSLGPLTAPMLRYQAYYPLFSVAETDYAPGWLTACRQDLQSLACLPGQLLARFAPQKYASCVDNRASRSCPLHPIFEPFEDNVAANDPTGLAQCAVQLGNPACPLAPLLELLVPDDLNACLADPLAAACPLSQVLPDGDGSDEETADAEILVDVADSVLRGCDFLDPNYCMYPFPNDYFTIDESDPQFSALQAANPITSGTGRRINFNPLAMPRNRAGKPLDPTEWNRNDGYSPGQLIEVRVPALSLRQEVYQANGDVVPRLTDLQLGEQPESVIAVFEVEEDAGGRIVGLRRHLVFAELDQNQTAYGYCESGKPIEAVADLLGGDAFADAFAELRMGCEDTPLDQPSNPAADAGPALLIRPAVNFTEGARYVVALTRLRDADGELIEPSPGFRVYRDQLASSIPLVEARRAHVDGLIEALDNFAGIARDDLYLTWDFTVASRANLTGRLAHMIEQSADWLDDALPQQAPTAGTPLQPVTDLTQIGNPLPLGGVWRIDSVVEDPTHATVRRTVKGTVQVPSYMNAAGGPPGARLYYEPGDDRPDRIGGEAMQEFTFTCRVPAQASSSNPARPSLYGHGLLGSQGEVESSHVRDMGQHANIMYCGLDWIGMSTADVPNVATILVDMSNFPTLADRAQQGILQFILMGLLLNDEDGLVTDAAFADVDGEPLFDPAHVFYDGNSQGGIMGGAVVAMSPNIDRGVLGVPGMNYSTLLRRSVDFDGYGAFMYAAYPDSLDQSFILSMIQMLWDRAESNGYMATLRDDVDKAVLLHVGYADHQVADIAADAMARTIGAKVYAPEILANGASSAVKADRHSHTLPYYGIERWNPAEAWDGSGLVVWDIGPKGWDGDPGHGTDRAPACNLPPRDAGRDPHEAPRRADDSRPQKDAFLRSDGLLRNFCGSEVCYATSGSFTYPGGAPDNAYQSPCEDR